MEAAAVNVDVEKEVAIASRLENPFHIKASKETEEENKNENKDLDCEGKVWPAVAADGNLTSRPCDNSIIDSPSSEACSSGTAGESCGITERPGDPSSMPASNDIVKQSKKDEAKVEDEDLKSAEGNGDYTSTPRDSNILDSTSSELSRPVQGSYATSKEPQYCSDAKTGKKILHSEEQKNEDKDVKGEVWPKAEDSRLACKSSHSNTADSTCSEPIGSGGVKESYAALTEPQTFSDSKIKNPAEQSAERNSASEDKDSICKVLSKLGEDDSLAPKPCSSNLVESTCPETNCSSATDETSVRLDNPHGFSSFEPMENKAGKQGENDNEGHGSSSIESRKDEEGQNDSEEHVASPIEPRKNEAEKKEQRDSEGHCFSSIEPSKTETGKEEQKDSEGHCSSIESRKNEAGKGQNDSEGHGTSCTEPRKKENDNEGGGSSSIEPRKQEGGKEDNDGESEHGDLKGNLQPPVEKLASNSSEQCDSQACVKASSSFEPCSRAVDDHVLSKEPENSSFTETSKEVTEQEEETEDEEESDDEEDQEGKCHPSVSKFLHRYIKIGKYTPASMLKAHDFHMKKSDTLLEAPSLVTPLLIKRPDYFLTENTNSEGKRKQKRVLPLGKGGSSADDFFGSTAGEFFIGIGLSIAREVYNREQLRRKKCEIKKAGDCAQEVIDDCRRLAEVHQKFRIANAPYNFKMKSCSLCDFKTESSLVLEGHLLTPHLTPRRELRCSFCGFTTRDRQAFVFHVEAMHNRQTTVEPPLLLHQCPFCPFETNLKTKATSHVSRCEKVFSIAANQQLSYDFQPPGVTAKPITLDDVRSYEKILLTLGQSAKGPQKGSCAARSQNGAPALLAPRRTVPLAPKKPRSDPLLNPNDGQIHSQLGLIRPNYSLNQVFQFVGSDSKLIPLHNGSTRQTLALAHTPSYMANLHIRAPAPVQAQQQTQPQAPKSLNAAGSSVPFVVCEICDGYLTDLVHLRLHMHRIHHLVIHRATLTHRPPLNCQKCERRFFTDQGLERHLLGSHGMVTPNMQSLAKRSKDAGRCPACGRMYAAKLVSHMSEVHKMAIRLATLSYKCTVCAAVFELYQHFENHVRKVHAKAPNKSSAAALKDAPAKMALSAQASTPTTAQHNSSKRPCLAAASTSTTAQRNYSKRPCLAAASTTAPSQPDSAKQLFLPLTSSPVTSDTNSAKRPLLASTSSPASANSSSAKRPFLATASTSATANLNSAKRPCLAAASTPTTAQPNSATQLFLAPRSSPESSDNKSTKQPILASTSSPASANSSSAKQPFLARASTSAVAKTVAIPATGAPSSEMKPIACLPADQPTKQPLSALATVATAVTKATSVLIVESNSKLKERSSMSANPVCKPAVSEIKVEQAVDKEVAPSVPLELDEPVLGWCVMCKEGVKDLAEHLKDKHMRQCHVRVCRIERCDLCLSSFRGLIVVTTSDVEDEESSEEDGEEDDSENE